MHKHVAKLVQRIVANAIIRWANPAEYFLIRFQMTIDDLLKAVRTAPESIEFTEVIDVIANNYTYSPTTFYNGELKNQAGTNEGSCKIFYFAQINQLSEMETLALFGHYYRDDVMGNPEGDDHGNIRNFILDGWLGIRFEGEALAPIVQH